MCNIGGGVVTLDMEIDQRTPGTLADSTKEALIATGKEAFSSAVDSDDIEDHLDDADQLFVATEDDKIIGYGGAEYTAGQIYLAGSFFHPMYQGKGGYHRVTKERVLEGLPDDGDRRLKTFTQNPRVHRGVMNVLHNLVLDGQLRFSTHRPATVDRYDGQIAPIPDPLPPLYEALDIESGEAYRLDFTLRT